MSQVPEPLVTQKIRQFAIKASIIFMLFTVASGYIIQDIQTRVSSVKSLVPKNKYRIMLMSFISNPVALYKLSVLDEQEGNLEDAIVEVELAIGLLEMHGAKQQVIDRYAEQLRELSSKIKTR